MIVAPGRARRPGAGWPRVEDATQEELDTCPFCAGREDRTPPETLTLGDPWRVRVVPNLYPAFARQEVVVHTRDHVRTIAELSDEQLGLVAEAWQRRAREHEGYVHALINEGHVAGGSLPHTHSQLVWLSAPPPEVARERDTSAVLDGEPVLERDGVALLAPAAPRLPYELRAAPTEREADAWHSDRLATALCVLADAARRLHTIAGGPVPLNAWLHHGDWWHLELVPRLTALAGIELGAGIYVVTVPPEAAADELRKVGG